MADRRRGGDRRDRQPIDPHQLVNDFQFVILNAPRPVLLGLQYFVRAQRELIEFVWRQTSGPSHD